MKYFQEYIETLKFGRSRNPSDSDKAITEAFSGTVPFVFLPSDGRNMPIDYDETLPLDLPFKKCFFEMGPDKDDKSVDISVTQFSGKDVKICGIYIKETSPRNYHINFLAWHYSEEIKDYRYMVGMEVPHSILKSHFLGIIQALLKRMYSEEVGEAKPRLYLKAKTSKGKIEARINKVVFIGRKQETDRIEDTSTSKVSWSHRWRVRGHWRTLKSPQSIGKGRDESEIVYGFTWVIPHVKGPEDALLIEKTRIVETA